MNSAHKAHWQPRDWIPDCSGLGPDGLSTEAAWSDVEFIVDWRIQGGGSAALLPRVSRAHEIWLEAATRRWVRTRLQLRDERVIVTHDEAARVSRDLPGLAPAGPLGLRHHERPVQFANSYVRPLV